mmetsp:Transcript_148036/g.412336  ORF Transcript_148036/g.412336 Transcript_148036/m.412336 type:complete len:254 (-) Transcript_148036:441-1202(-)
MQPGPPSMAAVRWHRPSMCTPCSALPFRFRQLDRRTAGQRPWASNPMGSRSGMPRGLLGTRTGQRQRQGLPGGAGERRWHGPLGRAAARAVARAAAATTAATSRAAPARPSARQPLMRAPEPTPRVDPLAAAAAAASQTPMRAGVGACTRAATRGPPRSRASAAQHTAWPSRRRAASCCRRLSPWPARQRRGSSFRGCVASWCKPVRRCTPTTCCRRSLSHTLRPRSRSSWRSCGAEVPPWRVTSMGAASSVA